MTACSPKKASSASARTDTPRDGPQGAQAQTRRPLSPSYNLTSKAGTKARTEHAQWQRPGLKAGLASWQQGRHGANATEGAAAPARNSRKPRPTFRGCEEKEPLLPSAPTKHTTRVPQHDLTDDTPPLLGFGHMFCMP